ncbi:hypothetical protein F5148DRAFT_194526 [Russula earlei]|uniref:Uncharacterized protein n=1 Tax=Russula earlei TaxID=71964 RepID=A0ACC0U7B2_9AGAM|nr:hypothetical protein F5148DRAFT_194526 [Russula earlei]
MSEMLDDWPVLPVVISLTTYSSLKSYIDLCCGNVADALESEHHYRICELKLSGIPTSYLERFAGAMRKPFQELTFLRFWVKENTVTSLPDSFLGGSAPLLRQLVLGNCSFPGLPKLLLSANHLHRLSLHRIPDSGYVSPQDLATALSVMSRLESFLLGFRSPRSRPDPASRPPPPLTRSVLPALTRLVFRGVHEYLEDLLAQIEAPLLNKLDVFFFMDVDFVVPQLHQLITHTESFKTCDRAFVCTSYYHAIQFGIFRETNDSPEFSLEIKCRKLDRQLSSLAQVCSPSLLLLSTLVRLDIEDPFIPNPRSYWKDDLETTRWLELMGPFTAVKDLCLSSQVAQYVCQALEELAEERVTEVLPELQNIVLSGFRPLESIPKYIQGFVAARQLSGHPVAVRWRNYSSIRPRSLGAFPSD